MDDLISRQMAIKAFDDGKFDIGYCTEYGVGYNDGLDYAIDKLSVLPSVQRKRGKWIKMSDADGIYFACSICGENIPRISHFDPQFDLFPRLESIDKTNYCPNCGADLRVKEE